MDSRYFEFYKLPIYMKAEVMYTLQECRDRCLRYSTKFLSEILVTLKDVPPFFDYDNEDNCSVRFEFEPAFTNLEDYLVYCKTRAYFDTEDYPGCAHTAKHSNNSKSMFLHYYARYLDMHNESIYDRANIFDSYKPLNLRKFMELLDELLILNVYGNEDDSKSESDEDFRSELNFELDPVNQINAELQDDSTPKKRRYSMRPRIEKSTTTENKTCKSTKRDNMAKKFKESTALSTHFGRFTGIEPHQIKGRDPYLLWLTAVMLKRIDRCDEGVELLIRAIQLQPCHWGAWQELSTLIKDTKMFDVLNSRLVGNNEHHWMHLLFIAQVFIDFQITERAVNIYCDILRFGHPAFKKWPYLHCQLAVAFHNKRGKDEILNSIRAFTEVLKLDPYRIDHFDLLSNLMYISNEREEIICLSSYVASIDLYRQESLCVLGNMYSLKGDHAKSVSFYKKAVSINPLNVTAWTLLGHEYIEMKNSTAAIVSYRHALNVNAKDYRAWHGLGQIYEQLKLPNYALFYFIQTCELRPRDFRMLILLGEMYERTDHLYKALVCYYKASKYDNEGLALLKLGKYYERYGSENRLQFQAMNKKALKLVFKKKSDLELNLILCKIYLYLGHYNMDIHLYDRAINYCEKCRSLCIEIETSEHYLVVMEHISALISEIGMRKGFYACPSITQEVLKTRRSLFTL